MFHSRAADTGGAARIPPTRPLSLERASVSMGGRVKRVRLGHTRLRLHPLLLLAEASSALRARSHTRRETVIMDPWSANAMNLGQRIRLVCVDTADAFTVARATGRRSGSANARLTGLGRFVIRFVATTKASGWLESS